MTTCLVYQKEILMARRDDSVRRTLEQDLADLKLLRIAEIYQEVLDEAARKGSTPLQILSTLIAAEAAARNERALQRRIQRARLPQNKTLDEYDFTFPKRVAKQTILRLFDCDFVARHGCAVFIGPSGTGKTHLLTALGYRACQKGISVRFTRAVDMINILTTAQINGTLGKAVRTYTNPDLLLLDELGYLPIDKRGADLMFQVVAARYEAGSIVITTNRPFKDWGAIFDVDSTLATALIDRLMHHGEAIVIRGDSYRMKNKNTDSND
jgi:DNA replication protein DnaC